MIDVVRRTPAEIRLALGQSDGTERDPALAWDARSYVCHIVDNLRIWAERLAAAADGSVQPLGTYDTDLLATAREYSTVPLRGALWSLADAVATWMRAVEDARHADVTLQHPERGALRVSDVASTNAHDAYHHLFDIRRSLP